MMEGFTRTEIKTSGANIVTVRGGNGPPLLLIHGNPFTHLSWHKFAPRLAKEFTVVAIDLRGYGDSSKPPGGDNHENYSFRNMALDGIEVMASLGFKKFMTAGHDRGGRVVHRMCLDNPDKVERDIELVFNAQSRRWSAPLLNHLLYARRPPIFRAARAMWTGLDQSGLLNPGLAALINVRVAHDNRCTF